MRTARCAGEEEQSKNYFTLISSSHNLFFYNLYNFIICSEFLLEVRRRGGAKHFFFIHFLDTMFFLWNFSELF